MTHPIRPSRLIHQAKVLAGYGAGRGRPSPTDHRRAVSTAYYALFHAIIARAVERVLPEGVASVDDRLRAARWVQHADIKKGANWVVACAGETNPTSTPNAKTGAKQGVWDMFSVPAGGDNRVGAVPPSLRRIARAFVDLQEARHDADYDHLARFPKATAQRHVNAAENALSLLEANLGDPHVQRFLALVLFRSRRLD